MSSRDLILIDQARRALAAAKTIPEAAELRDQRGNGSRTEHARRAPAAIERYLRTRGRRGASMLGRGR